MTADSDEATAHNDHGRELAGEGRYDEAIEEFRKADELWRTDQSKDRKLALYNWADALRSQEDYRQATEKYGEAISVDPEHADAFIQLGNVRVEQERFDDPIEQFRQADELWRKKESKDRKKALWGWADALLAQKDYEQAADKCRGAICVDPDNMWTYHYLGGAFAVQERFDDAIEQYRKADEKGRKKESNKDRKFTLWTSG